MMKKQIYINGTNDCFKEKILFKCEGTEEGESIVLGEPFKKTKLPKGKFKDNSKENPFNFMVAIETYEKAKGKENRFKEFYAYLEKVNIDLKMFFNPIVKNTYEERRSDYYTIRITEIEARGIKYSLYIDLNRKSITKIELSINGFCEKERREFKDDEFEEFKEYLEKQITIIKEEYKEKLRENPFLDEARVLIKKLEGEEKNEKYTYYSYYRDWGDSINLTIRFNSYAIPKKRNDTIKDYGNCFDIHLRFKDNEIKLTNGCFKVEEEDFENIKTSSQLGEYLNKKIEEAKKESKITEIEAKEELSKLKDEYNKENTLTEERFEEIKKNYNVDDKVTLYGVGGCFGLVTFEGRIARFEERGVAVIIKGGRSRGLMLRIGDEFKSIERGYKK